MRLDCDHLFSPDLHSRKTQLILKQIRLMKACYYLALFCVLSTSCATMVHGPLQKFVVTSDPKVAAVYVDGKHFGQTPIVIRMSRKKNHLLELKLDGYQTYQLSLKRKLDDWFFGNIVFGAVPGIAIDLLTGSIFKLTPKDIYPTLQARRRPAGDDSVAILVTMNPQPGWQKIGQLVED